LNGRATVFDRLHRAADLEQYRIETGLAHAPPACPAGSVRRSISADRLVDQITQPPFGLMTWPTR
jgi:hypothetical protein